MYRKNHVFAAACLGMLLFGIVFLSLGSVNNMLAERFKLDDRAIGTLTALLAVWHSCRFAHLRAGGRSIWISLDARRRVAVVGGVAGRHGVRRASERLCSCFVFAIGFGGGMLNGATNALAADVSEGERGAKLSLLGVFFGIGALTMPSTIATAVAQLFDKHDRGRRSARWCWCRPRIAWRSNFRRPSSDRARLTRRRLDSHYSATHSSCSRVSRWRFKAAWKGCRTIG